MTIEKRNKLVRLSLSVTSVLVFHLKGLICSVFALNVIAVFKYFKFSAIKT